MSGNNNTQVVVFDAVRVLAYTSISGTYAAIGTPFTHIVRLICISNNTDGDMFLSTDASTDMIFVAAGGFKLFDLNINRVHKDQFWALPENTQLYVRYISAPSQGSVYIECLWGQ